MDAELKEMCRQAAGDTAADSFCCWCVILGHPLNPSAAVSLCLKGRSDPPHTCVCVCVSALAGWRTQGSSVWTFSSFLRPLSRHR